MAGWGHLTEDQITKCTLHATETRLIQELGLDVERTELVVHDPPPSTFPFAACASLVQISAAQVLPLFLDPHPARSCLLLGHGNRGQSTS